MYVGCRGPTAAVIAAVFTGSVVGRIDRRLCPTGPRILSGTAPARHRFNPDRLRRAGWRELVFMDEEGWQACLRWQGRVGRVGRVDSVCPR